MEVLFHALDGKSYSILRMLAVSVALVLLYDIRHFRYVRRLINFLNVMCL